MSQKDLAQRVGVSFRLHVRCVPGPPKNMSPAVQARVESVLGGPVEIAPAECANRQDGSGEREG